MQLNDLKREQNLSTPTLSKKSRLLELIISCFPYLLFHPKIKTICETNNVFVD